MTVMEMRSGFIGRPASPKGSNWPGREGNSYEVGDVHAQPQSSRSASEVAIETTKIVKREGLDAQEARVLFDSVIGPLPVVQPENQE